MNITDALKTHNKEVVQMVSRFTGLSENDVQKVIDQILPAISTGMKTAATDKDRANEIFDTLQRDTKKLDRYLKKPQEQTPEDLRSEGENFLELIFGGKEVSRNVAKKVSEKTQVSDTQIKEALPLLITVVMGVFNKLFSQQQLAQGSRDTRESAQKSGTSLNELLLEFFDADKDGSVLDDLMGFLNKFLGKAKEETRH